jgi:hypothetical protein
LKRWYVCPHTQVQVHRRDWQHHAPGALTRQTDPRYVNATASTVLAGAATVPTTHTHIVWSTVLLLFMSPHRLCLAMFAFLVPYCACPGLLGQRAHGPAQERCHGARSSQPHRQLPVLRRQSEAVRRHQQRERRLGSAERLERQPQRQLCKCSHASWASRRARPHLSIRPP